MYSALICNPGLVGLSSCWISEERSKHRGEIYIRHSSSGKYEVRQIAGCGDGNDACFGVKDTYEEALALLKEEQE